MPAPAAQVRDRLRVKLGLADGALTRLLVYNVVERLMGGRDSYGGTFTSYGKHGQKVNRLYIPVSFPVVKELPIHSLLLPLNSSPPSKI